MKKCSSSPSGLHKQWINVKDMADKLYYTIGEVAGMFNVNTSLIRFWEKEFSILKPQKNQKGNRLFTSKDIENFRLIYNLVKEKGYTIQGAREYLSKNRGDAQKNQEIVKKLTEIRNHLQDLEKDLS
jgi:DNA-binding transcriptional MerR regulator